MNDFTNKTRNRLLVAFALFLVVYGGWVVVYNVSGSAEQDRVKQAEIARITADPLSTASVLNQINDQRTKVSVARLTSNPDLVRSAEQKCTSMATENYYDHKRPSDGKKGADWIRENTKNWKVANENLTKGDLKASFQAVDSWLNSPVHKATMLDPKYTDTGLAICTAQDGQQMVVQHFAAYYSVD